MGVVYIMGNFPYIYRYKIGITRTGVDGRLKGINQKTKGRTFPILPMPLFCRVLTTEKSLHRLLKWSSCGKIRGSGGTEWHYLHSLPIAVVLLLIEGVVQWAMVAGPVVWLVWRFG